MLHFPRFMVYACRRGSAQAFWTRNPGRDPSVSSMAFNDPNTPPADPYGYGQPLRTMGGGSGLADFNTAGHVPAVMMPALAPNLYSDPTRQFATPKVLT